MNFWNQVRNWKEINMDLFYIKIRLFLYKNLGNKVELDFLRNLWKKLLVWKIKNYWSFILSIIRKVILLCNLSLILVRYSFIFSWFGSTWEKSLLEVHRTIITEEFGTINGTFWSCSKRKSKKWRWGSFLNDF